MPVIARSNKFWVRVFLAVMVGGLLLANFSLKSWASTEKDVLPVTRLVTQNVSEESAVINWVMENLSSLVKNADANKNIDATIADSANLLLGNVYQVGELPSSGGITDADDIKHIAQWLVPVSTSDGEAKAIVSVTRNATQNLQGALIFDDRFSALLAGATVNYVFVQDKKLNAWFGFVQDKVVAGDVRGGEILLGALPITEFMEQRNHILGQGKDPAALVGATTKINVNEAHETEVGKILLVLGAAGLLAFSLAWLVWEQQQARTNSARPLDLIRLLHIPTSTEWKPVYTKENVMSGFITESTD